MQYEGPNGCDNRSSVPVEAISVSKVLALATTKALLAACTEALLTAKAAALATCASLTAAEPRHLLSRARGSYSSCSDSALYAARDLPACGSSDNSSSSYFLNYLQCLRYFRLFVTIVAINLHSATSFADMALNFKPKLLDYLLELPDLDLVVLASLMLF